MSRLSKTHAVRPPALSVALGAAYSLAAIVVLFAAAAIFTNTGILSESFMPITSGVCAFIGTLMGTHIAIRHAPERKLLISLGSAVLLFIFIFATGRAISGEAKLESVTLAALPAILGGGVISGFVHNRQKRTKR